MVLKVSVVISRHTTSSRPSPHVLYVVEVTVGPSSHEVFRRYSEFRNLQCIIGDQRPLPPKHLVVANIFSSSGWVDDGLIQQRKQGLQSYLENLLADPVWGQDPHLFVFLGIDQPAMAQEMHEVAHIIKGPKISQDDKILPIAASYYPAWASGALPPKTIDFSKFDILFYAFATPTGIAGIDWDEAGDESILRELVSCARSSGCETKIVLSVGGWTGSRWFSRAMSTSTNRAKLVDTLITLVGNLGLDGIDVDWEYPNAPGAGNPHASNDSDNFLSFFQLLRSKIGTSKILSAAVTQLPWLGDNAKPLADVSEFAKVLNYVNIMNYDAFEAGPKPGPNAPLGDLCGTNTQPEATAQAAFAQWTGAGMPVNKLLLGLPLYGYVSKSVADKLTGSSLPSADGTGSVYLRRHHHSTSRHPKGDKSLRALPDITEKWGEQVGFNELVRYGILVKNSAGNYDAGGGYNMSWDECSDTPYIHNKDKKTLITYDDTWSIASKTKYAKRVGMAGCFTWSLDQDDGSSLHDVMLSNLRK